VIYFAPDNVFFSSVIEKNLIIRGER